MNNRERFDRFTERARKVLSLAQEEAWRFDGLEEERSKIAAAEAR